QAAELAVHAPTAEHRAADDELVRPRRDRNGQGERVVELADEEGAPVGERDVERRAGGSDLRRGRNPGRPVDAVAHRVAERSRETGDAVLLLARDADDRALAAALRAVAERGG